MTRVVRVLIVAATLLPAAAAHAQDTLPPAEQIITRYHEAVGAAAFASIQSIHSIGAISIPAAGIAGTLEIWQARPNRTLIRATIPGFGDVQTGYTGTSGWSVDPSDGPRLLAGDEGTQAQDDAQFDSHLRTPALVDSMTVIERTTLAGYDCYKVRTHWKSGRITTDCFSAETGLIVGSMRTHHGSTGSTDALILYEEYRDFGGARLPTRITTRIEGVDQIITLQDVTLDSVPDSAFTPPAGIRSLLGG
ncbi:MAG TPA: hypothetical protein VFZ24_09125 [Longimicrobiales bacterium]